MAKQADPICPRARTGDRGVGHSSLVCPATPNKALELTAKTLARFARSSAGSVRRTTSTKGNCHVGRADRKYA
jgi:hypothetical protein